MLILLWANSATASRRLSVSCNCLTCRMQVSTGGALAGSTAFGGSMPCGTSYGHCCAERVCMTGKCPTGGVLTQATSAIVVVDKARLMIKLHPANKTSNQGLSVETNCLYSVRTVYAGRPSCWAQASTSTVHELRKPQALRSLTLPLLLRWQSSAAEQLRSPCGMP